MPLKTPQEYRESLRDGRVNYWDGERIDDVTTHPRFKVPIETVMRDYHYDAPGKRDLSTYTTEEGTVAHRVYQVPRTEEDLHKRVEMLKQLSIVGGTTSVYMALLTVKDQVARVNPERAENIQRLYRYARDNDLRASEVITDAKGDRSRRPWNKMTPTSIHASSSVAATASWCAARSSTSRARGSSTNWL